MTISAEDTVITLDVVANGDHYKSHMTLEHSPDGTNWLKSGQVTNGNGSMTLIIATAFVRACVVVGEGTAQTATIFITAK
tara:strand:- start:2012 stop:2251 length:240 start_codon:yes stop_codon:yes gene_type:complete